MISGSKLPLLPQASCVILGKPLILSEIQLLQPLFKETKALVFTNLGLLTKPRVFKGLQKAEGPTLLCQMTCYKYMIHGVLTSCKISQLEQISYPWSLLFNCLNNYARLKGIHIVQNRGGRIRFKRGPVTKMTGSGECSPPSG